MFATRNRQTTGHDFESLQRSGFPKGPVKLIQRVKIADSFLQSV